MKILIVEDDKNSMKLMIHFMNRFGTCNTADDGLQAVAAVMDAYKAGECYDLLIMDIMMPNLDGLETLQSIRAYEERRGIPKERFVKAIMVSALSGDTIRAEAYEKGCMAYMRKPIDFDKLERIIRDEFFVEECTQKDEGTF